MSKPMDSNLINEDRSVKVRGIIRSTSVLCLWATKTATKSVVKPQKRNKICVAEGVDIAWLLESRIVADGLYFSLCSPLWKLKVIRDLTRKTDCWISFAETNDWCCSDNKNYKLWTPSSTEGPPAKKVVDEMQWNPAISLDTNTRIKRMVRLYRQKVQIF